MKAKVSRLPADDRARMQAALRAETQLAGLYNTCVSACTTPRLRDTMLTLLNEEHQIQFDLFTELNKRGWCHTRDSDPEQVRNLRMELEHPPRQDPSEAP